MGINVEALIQAIGYTGIFLIVFAETGLLLGFLLPGDTLLITAGLLAQRGQLAIWLVIVIVFVAAVIGDAVGFEIGRHAGPRLYGRNDSRLFKKRHLERAKQFYDRHGGKTIFIARFLAFVRTFAPTVAGAAQMSYPRFAIYNVTGSLAWAISITWLGYIFGARVDNLELFFTGLVALMVAASVAPAAWHIWKQRRAAGRAAARESIEAD